MLTSFFSKSKPVNFTFAAVYMVLFLIIARAGEVAEFSFPIILREALVLLLMILSLVAFNFIAKRNVLTERNAYKTLFFAAFASMLFEALRDADIIIANFFVLLALRRIISLKSQQESIKKIFDATFLICVASIFYFWSILFLALIYLGIFIHLRRYGKLYLVPIIGFITALSITTSADLLTTDTFYTVSQWLDQPNFDFSAYRSIEVLVPVSFLFALTLWTLFFYLNLIQRLSGGTKSSHILVFLCLLISLGVAAFGPVKDSGELLFFLAPLVIMVTNYVQRLGDRWFKEMLLWLVVVIPFVLLIFF